MKRRKIAVVISTTNLFVFSLLTLCSLPERVAVSANQTGSAGSGSQRRAPKQLEPIALRLAAAQHNLRLEDVEITNSSVVQYRHSNKQAYLFDVEDKGSGEEYYIWLDATGNEIDRKKLEEEDSAARAAKYGKLSEDLTDYASKASPEQEIDVFILIELPPDTDPPKQPSMSMDSERLRKMTEAEKIAFEKEDAEAEKRIHDYYVERARQHVEPVAERLRKLSYEVQTFGTSSQIEVKLKLAMIKEVEKWKEVRRIDRVRTAKPALDVSRQVIGASLVENRRIDGSREQVALVEVNGGVPHQFGQSNPYPNLKTIPLRLPV